MFQEIYLWYQNVVFNFNNGSAGQIFRSMAFEVGGFTIYGNQYISIICALITEVIIVVLCCLFIYRIIRLLGRLFSGGTL